MASMYMTPARSQEIPERAVRPLHWFLLAVYPIEQRLH